MMWGGSLAVLESDVQVSEIQEQMGNLEPLPYWIGLRKKDGNWRWADGSALTYTNWKEGGPNAFKGVLAAV
jgi:hypothetical protein